MGKESGQKQRFGAGVEGKGRILFLDLMVSFSFILFSMCGNAWLGVPRNGAYTAWKGLGEDIRS